LLQIELLLRVAAPARVFTLLDFGFLSFGVCVLFLADDPAVCTGVPDALHCGHEWLWTLADPEVLTALDAHPEVLLLVALLARTRDQYLLAFVEGLATVDLAQQLLLLDEVLIHNKFALVLLPDAFDSLLHSEEGEVDVRVFQIGDLLVCLREADLVHALLVHFDALLRVEEPGKVDVVALHLTGVLDLVWDWRLLQRGVTSVASTFPFVADDLAVHVVAEDLADPDLAKVPAEID